MPSVHGYPDVSFKAGANCATNTAIYKAVYLSGDNTVDICNTTTTLAKFIGITQEYVAAAGQAITVRVAGATKAKLCGTTIAFGDLVGIAYGTATALGNVIPSTGKAANLTSTTLAIGKCIVGSAGGTDTICEVLLMPTWINGLTTTVGS